MISSFDKNWRTLNQFSNETKLRVNYISNVSMVGDRLLAVCHVQCAH